MSPSYTCKGWKNNSLTKLGCFYLLEPISSEVVRERYSSEKRGLGMRLFGSPVSLSASIDSVRCCYTLNTKYFIFSPLIVTSFKSYGQFYSRIIIEVYKNLSMTKISSTKNPQISTK